MSIENVDTPLIGILDIGTHIPHAQTIVHRIGGHMCAFRVKCKAGDRVDMTTHRVQTLGAWFTHVPHLDVIVDAARHELVFGGTRAHREYLKLRVSECDSAVGRRALAAIPYSHGEVVSTRAEHVR